MKIGGIQKVSLIDFPGYIATIVFTQGCNFRCQFCHNASLVLPDKFEALHDENEFFDLLAMRKLQIDAVVVSGGEPTLQSDLKEFLRKIKTMGFLSKIDTNGSNPLILLDLLRENLLDYVAMDVKHSFDKYSEIAGVAVPVDKVKLSIDLIKNSEVDYEFRMTVVPHFHSPDDIKSVAVQIAGAKRLAIQEFVPNNVINGALTNANSIFAPENVDALNDVVNFCKSQVGEVIVRSAN
jgi:pyruvate formate lyase activating enzyme